jgi:hypothetical protein
MKTFATVNPSEAMRLGLLLKADGIPFTARIMTEDSGLPAIELSTEDESFDSACNVAEAWLEAEYKERAANRSWSCPNCL